MGFDICKKIKRGVSRVWNAGKKVIGKIFRTIKNDRRNDDLSDNESDYAQLRMKYSKNPRVLGKPGPQRKLMNKKLGEAQERQISD